MTTTKPKAPAQTSRRHPKFSFVGLIIDLLLVAIAVGLWFAVSRAPTWLAEVLSDAFAARFVNEIRLACFALAIIFAAAAGLRLQMRFLLPAVMKVLSTADVIAERKWKTLPVHVVFNAIVLGGFYLAFSDAFSLKLALIYLACYFVLQVGLFRLARTWATHAWIAAAHLRAKKSSFLTAIGFLAMFAVCLSSCSLTTTLSIFGGFRHDLRQKILANTAHIVVDEQPEGEAARDATSRTLITNWTALQDAIRDQPGVTGASPIVEGEVMISSATQQAGAVVRGVPPDSFETVSDVPKNIRRGEYRYFKKPSSLPDSIWHLANPASAGGSVFDLDAGSKPHDAGVDETSDAADGGAEQPVTTTTPSKKATPVLLIGEEMARTLRVFVGDEVTLVTPFGTLGPSGPLPKSRTFKVAGIFYTGMYEFDMKHVYTSLVDAQRFFGLGDAVHAVEGRVEEPLEVIPTRKNLQARLSKLDPSHHYRVRDWQDQNRTLFGALALEKLAIFIVLTIAIAVAGFCILCTMLLMIQEKRSEVGVMRAIGANARDIVKVFVIEGVVLGLIGTAFGLEGGFLLGFAMQNLGIGMDPGVYYIDRLPVHMDPSEFALVGAAATIVCVLATFAPAWLATLNRPIDAIREL